MTSNLGRRLATPRVQVLLLAGSTYGTLLLGFVTGPLLARALGPTGRGEVAGVLVYASLTTTLLAFGTSTAVLHAARKSPEAEGEILGAVVRYSLWLLPVSVAAGVVVSQFVLVGFDSTARVWCFVFVSATPVGVLGLTLISLLLPRGALSLVALLRTTPTVLVAVVVVILAVTGDLTVASYLVMTFVVSILSVALAFAVVRVRPRRSDRLRPLLSFGSRAWIGSLANTANVGLDQALIGPFLGAEDLGHYAIATTLSLLPLGLATAIGYQIWGDLNVGTDEQISLERVGVHTRLAMASAIWAALGIAVLAPVGVPWLYGDAFGASILPLLLMLPGTIAYSGAWVLEAALVMAGRPGVNSRAELTALLFTGICLAALLPVIGIAGAAVATSVAYTVRLSVQIWVLRPLGTLDWRPRAADMRYVAKEAVGLLRRRVEARGKPRPGHGHP